MFLIYKATLGLVLITSAVVFISLFEVDLAIL
jgi:hypothetical protein